MKGRSTLVFVVLALAVLALVSTAVPLGEAGGADGEELEVELEREYGHLQVNLSAIEAPPPEINVTLADHEPVNVSVEDDEAVVAIRSLVRPEDPADAQRPEPWSSLAEETGSLHNATVEVEVDGATRNETLDLRVVAIDESLPVWIRTNESVRENGESTNHEVDDAGGTDDGDGESVDVDSDDDTDEVTRNEPPGFHEVVIPLDAHETVGVTDEDRVRVNAVGTQGSGEFNGSIEADGGQLVVSHDNLTDAIGPSSEVALGIETENGSVTPTANETVLGTELRSVNETTKLWNPAFENATTYEVFFDDGQITYADSTRPVGPGEFDTAPTEPDERLVANVTAPGGIDPFVAGEFAVADPIELEATVEDDSLEFGVGRALDGLAVTGGTVHERNADPDDDGDRELELDGAIEDGRLDLGDERVGVGDNVTLETEAGLLRIPLVDAPPDDGNGGITIDVRGGIPVLGLLAALTVAPPLVGVLVGLGSRKIAGLGSRNVPGLGSRNVPDVGSGRAFDLDGVVAPVVVGTIGFALAAGFAATILSLASGVEPWPPTSVVHGAGSVAALLGGIVAAQLAHGGESDDEGGQSRFTADVTVTDGKRRLDGELTVYYRPAGTRGTPESTTIEGGRGRLELPGPGVWELITKREEYRSNVVEVSESNPNAELTIAVPAATITVTDGDRPIPEARVEPVDGDRQRVTDEDGTATVALPVGRQSVDVRLSHDRYRETVATVEPGSERSVELEPKTGDVRLVTRVDGTPTDALSPRLASADDGGSIPVSEREAIGTTVAENVPIGRYRASVSVPSDRGHFEGDRTTFVVEDGTVATVELDVRFRWRLSADRRDRIAEVRRASRALTAHTRRDTTVPGYYASVVETLLDTVEALPEEGGRFLGAGIDPDALADATIAAAGKATYAIERAMETERNVDLFAVWAGAPTEPIRWNGDGKPERLFDRLEDSPEDLYVRASGRYETLSTRVERERGTIPATGPLEDQLMWTWNLLGDGASDLEIAVSAHAALVLFDAIETLLDHPEFRRRQPRRTR